MAEYSLTVEGVKNDTKHFGTLQAGVSIANGVDQKGVSPFLDSL